MNEYSVYRCPADVTNKVWAARNQKYSSYLENGAACYFQVQQKPDTPKAASIRQDAILFWQARETTPGDFNDGSSSPDEGITGIHLKGTTVGIISGSVEYLRLIRFAKEAKVAKGRLWWNPKTPDGH